MKSSIITTVAVLFLFAAVVSAEEIASNEAELRDRLECRCTIPLDENMTFEGLFTILLEKQGIQATIDPRGAGALGIVLASPVVREPLTLKNIPLRQFLRFILAEQDLTYVNREGVLMVTSEDEAKKYMNTKVYSVADLVLPEKVVRDENGVRFTTDWNRTDKADFSELMDLIEAVVAPDSWDEGGEMMEFYPGLSLVVRQTDEVHDELEKLLGDLRKNRKIPSGTDSPVVKSPTPNRKAPASRFGRLR